MEESSGLALFKGGSYLADKILFHFLGGFHQQLSGLSSTEHMSLWAAGCATSPLQAGPPLPQCPPSPALTLEVTRLQWPS